VDELTGIEKVKQVLSKALQDEWEAQGHSMTNKIIETIDYVVKQETDAMTISGMMYPYGAIIAAGVTSSKIPYSGHKGKGHGGGTSQYIQGIQSFVKLRMRITDEKKSLGIAFAIAQTQKYSGDWMGMPTRGSYAFTKTGKRLAWIEEAFKHNEGLITEVIQEMCWNVLSINFNVILNQWNKQLNS
jgi:hypothetical protein